MVTIDTYIALLEKRAMDESSVEKIDNAKETVDEYSRNQADSRQQLQGLFNHAGAVSSDLTATAKKVFPNAHGTKISGHPMLKVASRAVFFAALEHQHVKIASPLQREVAYHSFCDELEKIAADLGM